ncbi:MAG: hypothetical protein CSA20_05840 [Deltaproteobacteria bacterium]|nr:MAG: hypothetical protein CSA20_05840 [Deltaproteobacteria bacterium]
MKYLVGNWKSQKTTADGLAWLERFAARYIAAKDVTVVLAPTLVSLETLAAAGKRLRLSGFSFAVQDISPFPRGSYTGAVAADLVREVAGYAIVGHGERRRYFHEDSGEILNKASEAVDAGIVPLVCVEDAPQLGQLSSLIELEGKILLAYTPRGPVVSEAAPVEEVSEMVARMRRSLPQAAVLYGGGITFENCGRYLDIEGVDGLFVGSASLDAEDFAALCNRL